MKRVKSSTNWIDDGDDIPDWLLMEVLIRLPLKTIFRFKLVSKRWLSTILEPYFVRSYCSRALLLSQYQPWTILSSKRIYTNGHLSLDCDIFQGIYSSNKKSSPSSFHPFSVPNCEKANLCSAYDICEVSNGLVLFSNTDIIQIFNPATGQRLSLPPRKTDYYKVSTSGFYAKVEDGVLLSFIVVFMQLSKNETLNSQAYFSQTDEWKTFNVRIDKPTTIKFLGQQSTVLNGIFHWIVNYRKVLIAYDPEKSPNQASIIALPEDRLKYYNTDICWAYQGKLRYCRMNCRELSDISIWVMNDYSSGNWSLQHRVSYADIQLYYNDVSIPQSSVLLPISFHPYDSNIVYFKYANKDNVFTYNMKTKHIQVEEFNRGNRFFLLMIPTWPISRCHPSIRGWDL